MILLLKKMNIYIVENIGKLKPKIISLDAQNYFQRVNLNTNASNFKIQY